MKRSILFFMALLIVVSFLGCTTTNQGTNKTTTVSSSSSPVVTTNANEGLVAPPTKKAGPIKLAFVPSVMNVYYDQVLSGIKEEVDKLGGSSVIEILIQAPTSNQTSVNEQIDIMENLIEQGVDVIAISAESDEPLSALFEKAAKAGIVIFEFNMPTVDLTSKSFVSNIGYDQFIAGRLIGEWAVKHFGDKVTKTAVLEGFPGTLNTQRLEGFKKGIEGHDNIEIVFSQTANWNRDNGQSVTENLLQSNKDINFIVGLYDEMSLGAYSAVKAVGLQDKIVIAGYDMTLDGYKSIKNGEMYMSVDNRAKDIGKNITISAYQYCMLGKKVNQIIDVGSAAYDINNIEEFDTNNYVYVEQKPIPGYLQN